MNTNNNFICMVVAKGLQYQIAVKEEDGMMELSMKSSKHLSDFCKKPELPVSFQDANRLLAPYSVSIEDKELIIEVSMQVKKTSCTYVRLMNLVWEMKMQIHLFFAELQAMPCFVGGQ